MGKPLIAVNTDLVDYLVEHEMIEESEAMALAVAIGRGGFVATKPMSIEGVEMDATDDGNKYNLLLSGLDPDEAAAALQMFVGKSRKK